MAAVNVFDGTHSSYKVPLTIRSLKSVVCVPFPWIQVSLRLLQWKGQKRNEVFFFPIFWEQQHPIRTIGGQFAPPAAPSSRAGGVDWRPGSGQWGHSTPPPASLIGSGMDMWPRQGQWDSSPTTKREQWVGQRTSTDAWKSKSPLFYFKIIFIDLCLAGLGLRCCTGLSVACSVQGLFFVVVCRLLTVAIPPIAEHSCRHTGAQS